MALQSSKTCKVWILLNPSMFYSGCLRVPSSIFLSFATLFESLIEFSQWFYSNSLLLNAPSLLAASPFYSVILGFRCTIDSSHLLSWVPEPMLCQQLRWLIPSLLLIIFFFWCFFSKNLLLTFRSGVSLESWPLISLPSRLQNLTFFRLCFLDVFPFVIFPKWANSIPARLKVFPATSFHGSSFLDSLRYQPLVHELLVPKHSGSFLHHWVADKDIFVLRSLCFLAFFLSCLNLILTLLHIPRISSSW